jgi:2-keto-3-deoxy-L-rhamnonate aldolase RhmA
MSAINFDFLVVDAEHSAIDISNSIQMLQAIKAANPSCIPFVRLPNNQYSVTKR